MGSDEPVGASLTAVHNDHPQFAIMYNVHLVAQKHARRFFDVVYGKPMLS
jgi:hypothetical protein